MPLYQREGSPFWWYSFTVHGVRFRGSTECTGKREAQLIESEKRLEAKSRRTHIDDWRLRDCFGAYWFEHAQHRRSSKFVKQKLDTLSRILGPDTPLANVSNKMLLDYRAQRRGEGLEPHSVNRDLSCLMAALNHAQQLHGKAIPALAWKRLKMPEPPGRIRFLSHEEYDDLIAVSDAELQRIITFAVLTGLRKANVLNLDWKEVDLSSQRITVTVKGDKLHSIRMPAPVRAMLARDQLRKGKVFDTKNFRRRWYRAVEEAMLEDLRFHDLRHTFASWARMAGADLADICEALGHSSVAVTMRYAHIEPTQHQTAFDRVSGAFLAQSASQSDEIERKA